LNVVDSSGWLEYLTDGTNAKAFAPAMASAVELLVPTIVLYEVFKKTTRERGEAEALAALAAMQQGQIVELSPEIAVAAAQVSLANKLPMADSIILASARAYDATLWTQDAHFERIAGVKYIAARK